MTTPRIKLELTCLRCGHQWFPRLDAPPARCASCLSPYWDRPRQAKREKPEPDATPTS